MIKNLGRRAALAGAFSAVGLLATTGAALASGIATTTEGTLVDLWGEYCRRTEEWARRIRASTLSYAAAEGSWPVAPKLIMWPTASGELHPRPSRVFQDTTYADCLIATGTRPQATGKRRGSASR